MRRLCTTLSISIALAGHAHAFCFEEAGLRYNLPPQLIWSISKMESRLDATAVNYNTNGTYDYGLMQINTTHAEDLRLAGIPWESLSDPCTNVMVGSWLLSKRINEYGYNWRAIGSYHSKTPSKRDRYAANISKILSGLNNTEKRRQPATTRQSVPDERTSR